MSVPAELLDRAWTALALAGPTARDRAVAVVRDAVARLAPEVPQADLEVLTDVLAHHRLAWRVTTSWRTTPSRRPEPDGSEPTTGNAAGTSGAATAGIGPTAVPASDVEVRALAVVDAGAAGLWRRDEPAEPLREAPRRDSQVTLVPVTTSQVWHALADLLPGRQAPPRGDIPATRLASTV